MHIERAIEIVNSQDESVNSKIFYKDNQVSILSINNDIGTAYVQSKFGNYEYEVDLSQLNEILF